MKMDNDNQPTKEERKQAFKLLGIIVGVFTVVVLFLGILGGISNTIFNNSNEETFPSASEEDIEATILILETSLHDSEEIVFNEDTNNFEYYFNERQTLEDITVIMNTNDYERWNNVVIDGLFMKYSKRVEDHLGEGYGVVLINPWNHDNNLLEVKDGQVIYDFMDD